MNNVLEQMLKDYEIKNLQDEKNAIKEIIQEIVLCGLARAKFFDEAAFYGGTALRIFYGLDRFSEDLDFSLIKPNKQFDLKKYFIYIEKEANSYGLNLSITEKEKSEESNITSAFLKGDTKEHILLFFPNDKTIIKNNKLGNIKIKFEIDINPPKGATYEFKTKLLPSPHQVRLYDEASLFAGKIHAILCRNWKTRFKGRDLYDYVFYLSRGASVNLIHLREKLLESNYIDNDFNLDIDSLKDLLQKRFNEIDFESAKEDVQNFITDTNGLKLWNKEFFCEITDRIK